jgi:predicted nucleic acid-binding protein
MRSERLALDTNILLYVLGGDGRLNELLSGRDIIVSSMVRMEAMVYHGKDPEHLALVNVFLGRCELVEIHRSIQDVAVELRMKYRLKLPDAIIAATAIHLGIPLITADNGFAKLQPDHQVLIYSK